MVVRSNVRWIFVEDWFQIAVDSEKYTEIEGFLHYCGRIQAAKHTVEVSLLVK